MYELQLYAGDSMARHIKLNRNPYTVKKKRQIGVALRSFIESDMSITHYMQYYVALYLPLYASTENVYTYLA